MGKKAPGREGVAGGGGGVWMVTRTYGRREQEGEKSTGWRASCRIAENGAQSSCSSNGGRRLRRRLRLRAA